MPIRLNAATKQFDVFYDFDKAHSDVHGLKYIPMLKNARPGAGQDPKHITTESGTIPVAQNDLDVCVECDHYVQALCKRKTPPVHQTKNDFNLISERVKTLNASEKPVDLGPKCIVEIGVDIGGQHRKPDWPKWKSFTYVLYNTKDIDVLYFGLDIKDKSYINDAGKNIHTFKCDSFEQELVRNELARLGVKTIDILLIDGYHSVNAMVNDWKYADMLSPDGLVLVHDINCHPGPRLFMDALDESQYSLTKHFINDPEFGLAEVKKLIRGE